MGLALHEAVRRYGFVRGTLFRIGQAPDAPIFVFQSAQARVDSVGGWDYVWWEADADGHVSPEPFVYQWTAGPEMDVVVRAYRQPDDPAWHML